MMKISLGGQKLLRAEVMPLAKDDIHAAGDAPPDRGDPSVTRQQCFGARAVADVDAATFEPRPRY